MESCTLHNSMFISILEISIVGIQLYYFWTIPVMEIFSSFYSWGTQGMKTINPVLCFAPGCLTCLPKNLPAALLAPWKCKCMRPESPPLHTAPEMSLLAQQQQWEIQHISRAWINSESLMLLATIKHSCAQVSKPGLAGSAAGAAQPHLHHRSMILPVQKLEMMWNTAMPSEQLPHPLGPLWLSRIFLETVQLEYLMLQHSMPADISGGISELV